ncbi:MAG: AAA family ATPase, partial [Rickettsiales bacterium]|nr:AAA family ATPase [Rickettsiales bacterium]
MSDNPIILSNLPLGVSDYREIVSQNYFYADKTRFLYPLVKQRKPYFLSRPRRFGKTLLVDTMENILRGHKDLFEGLWINSSDYDWTPYPVIRLDMLDAKTDDPKLLKDELCTLVQSIANKEKLKVDYNPKSPYAMFSQLIELVYNKYGEKEKVAVLIDEYDAPIVFYVDEPEKANMARKILGLFYEKLKSAGKYIGHIFITGVSRFTKTSLFSVLNIEDDLTFDPRYASICGFTQEDVD